VVFNWQHGFWFGRERDSLFILSSSKKPIITVVGKAFFDTPGYAAWEIHPGDETD
jgi:hypothetical protein